MVPAVDVGHGGGACGGEIERAFTLAALAWTADNWSPEERDKLLADCAQAGKIPTEDMDTFYEIIEMLIQRKHELGIR